LANEAVKDIGMKKLAVGAADKQGDVLSLHNGRSPQKVNRKGLT
jgi:hypothetical protein